MNPSPPPRHREFFDLIRDADARDAWRTLPTAGAPLREVVLADDLDTTLKRGSRTRLVRWAPGALLPEPVVHDFHEQVFVVEQNRDGQMKQLLVNEGGIDPSRLVSIRHYDGNPITARFVHSAIRDSLKAGQSILPERA